MAYLERENAAGAYRTLRRVVGALGVLLPVILAVGGVLFDPQAGLENSISAYYGTKMRNVLVGTLFAIGSFLFSYHGYDRKDEVAGYLACAFALGVALFPVTSDVNVVKYIHTGCAVALFLVLSFFSLVLFTMTNKEVPPTPQKEARNRIYRGCGVFMLGCIALLVLYKLALEDTPVASLNPVFWMESLALWAFGLSWFVKGETVLRDR